MLSSLLIKGKPRTNPLLGLTLIFAASALTFYETQATKNVASSEPLRRKYVFSLDKKKQEIKQSIEGHPPKNAQELIELANKLCKTMLGNDIGLPQQGIFYTRTHIELFDALWSQCNNLSKGNFIDESGIGSSMLIGAKGIGKTKALKAFTSIAGALFDNVVPIYISFESIKNSTSCRLANDSLSKILEEYWVSLGYKLHGDPEPFDLPGARLFQSAQKEGKYILLLIDELDQLYSMCPDKFPSCIHTLGDLVAFGNDDTGRVSVLLCGSSAVLPLLITANAAGDPILREEFPLAKSAPNLNCQKYITQRIHSSLPTAVNTVMEILKLNEKDENDFKIAKLVTFQVGTNALSVLRAVKNHSVGRKTLTGRRKDLYEKIMLKTYELNKSLYEKLFVDGKLNIEMITTQNWETEFTPLSYEDLHKIWKDIEGDNPNYEQLDVHLYYLSDRTWIVLDGIKYSSPLSIYPSSLMMVIESLKDEKTWLEIARDYMKSLNSCIEIKSHSL